MRSDDEHGGYVAWSMPLAPGSAEAVIEAANELLGSLR